MGIFIKNHALQSMTLALSLSINISLVLTGQIFAAKALPIPQVMINELKKQAQTAQGPAQKKQVQLLFNCPGISLFAGNLAFTGFFDLGKNSYSLVPDLTKWPQKVVVIPGVFEYETPQAILSEKGLSWTGIATVLGQKATMTLSELKIQEKTPHTIFSIKLNQPMSISVGSPTPILINSLNLYVSATQQTLYSYITYFSPDNKPNASISFDAKKENLASKEEKYIPFAHISLKTFPLGNFSQTILPELKKSVFNTIVLKNPVITFTNPLVAAKRPPVSIKSTIDFSSFQEIIFLKNMSGIPVDNLATILTLTEKEFRFKANLDQSIFVIPNISFFNVQNPTIDFTLPFSEKKPKEQKPTLMLNGQSKLSIPIVGTFNVTLSTPLKEIEKTGIQGTVIANIPALKEFHLNDGTVTIFPQKGSVEFSMDALVPLIETQARIHVNLTAPEKNSAQKDAPRDDKKNPAYSVKIYGELITQPKEISFFKKIPGLENTKMVDLSLVFNLGDTLDFQIKGSINFLGLSLIGEVFLVDQLPRIKIRLPEYWKLSSIPQFKHLKGSFFDKLGLTKQMFIISPMRYFDEELQFLVSENVAFAAVINMDLNELPLDENVKKALNIIRLLPFVPKIPENIVLYGGIKLLPPSPPVLTATFNYNIDFHTYTNGYIPLCMKDITLSVDLSAPSASVWADVDFWPPAFDRMPPFAENPVTLEADVDIDAEALTFSGGFEGEFKNPILAIMFPGLNFSLSNCFLKVGWKWTDLVATAAIPVPTVFGIAGDTRLGDIQAGAKLNIQGSSIDQWAFQAFVNHTSLKDLVTIFEAIIHQKIPGKETLPDIGIYGVKEDQPVEISAALKEVDIYTGASKIPMGFKLTGKAKILDKFSLIDFQFSPLRLAGRGTFPEIDLGFLLVTGRGLEGQKGPMVDIEVSLSRINVGLSGEIVLNPQGIMRLFPGANIKELEESYNEIFQARTKEDISLDAKGLNFSFETNLFGLYKTSLYGRTTTKGPKDITIQGIMQQEFLDTLKNGLEKNITMLHDAINKDIEAKQKQVNNIDILIDQKNKQIEENTNEIKKITEELTTTEIQANKKQEEILAKLNINPQIAKAIKSGLRNTSDIQNQIRGDVDEKLENAQQEVDKILNQIHAWENEQAECADAPSNRLDLKARWVVLGGLIAGAWATHAIAYGILEEIQKINAQLPTVDEIDNAVKTATFIPKSVPKYAAREALELKNSSLKTEITILQKTKEAATFTLKSSKDINDFAGETLQNIAKALSPLTSAAGDASSLINIREISFSTGLRELLIDKKLPHITVKLSLLNKEIPDFSMQCDLRKPNEFMQDLANYIVKAIQALTAKQRL